MLHLGEHLHIHELTRHRWRSLLGSVAFRRKAGGLVDLIVDELERPLVELLIAVARQGWSPALGHGAG